MIRSGRLHFNFSFAEENCGIFVLHLRLNISGLPGTKKVICLPLTMRNVLGSAMLLATLILYVKYHWTVLLVVLYLFLSYDLKFQADEGEALFYPRDYWHQTENLDTPTIAITGTLVDKNNYDSVTEQLAVDCHKKPLKLIHPSETLCRYYYQHCFPWWKIAYGDAEANYVHVEDAQDLKKARTSIGLKNERGYDTNWKTEVVETSSPGQFGCQLGSFDSADQSTHSYGFDEFYG